MPATDLPQDPSVLALLDVLIAQGADALRDVLIAYLPPVPRR